MKRRRIMGWVQIVVVLVLATLGLVACGTATPVMDDTALPADLPLQSATPQELSNATPALPADTAAPESPTPDAQPTDPGALQAVTLSLPEAPVDGQLPIFVEMVQAPLSPEPSSRMPPADGTPTGVYAFNPSDWSLLIAPTIQVLPTTEVLVGLSSATSPNRPYVAGALFQIPSTEQAPLRVIAIDADSGTLTLAYADQAFELEPGQSRSFKQGGEGELALVNLTTITSHGRLASIDSLPPDPGSP